MGEVCEFQIEHAERITALETDMATVKDKVESLGGIERSIERMTTLIEMQQNQDKKRDEQDNKRDEMLSNLSEANIKTTNILEKLETKFEDLNTKVDNLKTDVNRENDKNYIDIREVNKDVTTGWIKQHWKPVVGFSVGGVGLGTVLYAIYQLVQVLQQVLESIPK